MRGKVLGFLLVAAVACGGATDTGPTRYNFAVIDGRNQVSVAGDATLAKPITSQLTRDPQGKFATRVLDFLAPAIAYAQTLTLSGTPVANAIVCGREAKAGEPQVIPLCAFTLTDGTAANSVHGGTKAGKFNILFTAQVTSQLPVADSTTVAVAAGAMASQSFTGVGFSCWTVVEPERVLDQYGNPVPYRFVTTGTLAHTASNVLGSDGARTFVADRQSLSANGVVESQPVTVETAGGVIATGKLTVPNLSQACVWLNF